MKWTPVYGKGPIPKRVAVINLFIGKSLADVRVTGPTVIRLYGSNSILDCTLDGHVWIQCVRGSKGHLLHGCRLNWSPCCAIKPPLHRGFR